MVSLRLLLRLRSQFQQNFYEVKMISDCDENSNMLYIFLDIDTEHNYDINDLDDDDDFTDTYTLI